jgi:membrane peptidoglycan carboxypeptidase
MSMPPDRLSAPAALRRLGLLVVVIVATGVVAALIAVPFVGGMGVLTKSAIQNFEALPASLDTPPLPQRTVLLASDGTTLATLYYQNRVEVPLGEIAPVMRQAIISVEDSRFLQHHGFDFRGGMRALASNTSSGGVQEGASTLTMQYIKNVLVTEASNGAELEAARGRSATRKMREIRLALALEKRYSKAEILQRYLNIAYFGSGAYGVEAASRRYFSKPASALTLPEAATLAGIVQQPTAFDPLRNPDLSAKRRNVVLRRMADQGYITATQAEQASLTPMSSVLAPSRVTNGCTTSYAPFFCDYVLHMIRTDPTFGDTPDAREAFLKRGGYTIRTTLDAKAQQAAFTAVTSKIPIDDESKRAAAITMIQPGTGNILAMTQNRLWGTSGPGRTTYNYNVDRASGGTIGMQAGSTFKVFTIAAALEAGISPSEYISSPSPNTFENFKNCDTGVPYGPITVHNSTGAGTFDMARATAYSINTYFMALEERTGQCRPAEIAESMGVRLGSGEPLLRVPSFTLGTMEVAPLQLANAYATFANHGSYCTPRVLLDIRDRNGHAVPVPPVNCTQVLTRDVADSTTALLTGVIDGYIGGRTGQAMSLADRPAAGKTGTTNESAAVWFAGFTPDIAAAVWVGDPRGGYGFPMKDVTIAGRYYSQVFGSTLPGPIWKEAMTGASEGHPASNFILESSVGLKPARETSASYYRPSAPAPKPVTPDFEFTNPEPAASDGAPASGPPVTDPAASGQDPAPVQQDPAPVPGQ